MQFTVKYFTGCRDHLTRLTMGLGFLVALPYSATALNGDAASSLSVVDEDGSCVASDGSAVVAVSVDNIQVIEGNLRAQIYSSNPDDFLEKGKKLVRVDVPVISTDTATICVPLPEPGTYALVVMHDKNSNGKADFFTEGFGFSNNPKLSLGPPDAEEVMFMAAPGVNAQPVTLNYIFGSDDENKDKRRRLKRR